MPKFMESRLRDEADRQGMSGDAADRYVYGAENNMGFMKGSKITAKGKEAQRQHDAEMHAEPDADDQSSFMSRRGGGQKKRGFMSGGR